jgi:hypothetical protein
MVAYPEAQGAKAVATRPEAGIAGGRPPLPLSYAMLGYFFPCCTSMSSKSLANFSIGAVIAKLTSPLAISHVARDGHTCLLLRAKYL